jgi:hypothetical protein
MPFSSLSESKVGHSMVGKAIESSTFWDASKKTLISKLSNDPSCDLDLFIASGLIIGSALWAAGIEGRLRLLCKAAVAGVALVASLELDSFIRNMMMCWIMGWISVVGLAVASRSPLCLLRVG